MCATRSQTVVPELFRSYPTISSQQHGYELKVWEAARATSAAPLIFEPFKIERHDVTVVDGAIRLNNPIYEAMLEAKRIDRSRSFGCVVSIGTGVMDIHGIDESKVPLHQIARTCADISINCDRVAQDFVGSEEGSLLHKTSRYFRFDVRRRMDAVDMVDWGRFNDITAFVDDYLSRSDVGDEIERCARALS